MRLSPFSRFIFFHFSLLSQFFFLLFFPLFSVFLPLFFPSIWLAFCFKILFLGNLASKKKMVKGMRKKTVTKWNKFLLTDNKLMILFHIHSSNFSFFYYYVPFFILTSLSTLYTTMTRKIQANKAAERSEKWKTTENESMYLNIYILYMLKVKWIYYLLYYTVY